jgi:hypothetical protein
VREHSAATIPVTLRFHRVAITPDWLLDRIDSVFHSAKNGDSFLDQESPQLLDFNINASGHPRGGLTQMW